jgi:glutamate-5-semialdehyde dehydrogenase
MRTETISVREQAVRARAAAPALATAATSVKNEALLAIAARLLREQEALLAANALDLAAGGAAGIGGALLKRLELSPAKIGAMAEGVRQVAALPDPIGEEVARFTRPNGLELRKVRVPLGVIGMIYEARPNVTVDAAVLCLKAGNTVVLKGGREAAHSNEALADLIRGGLADAGLPADALQMLPPHREAATELMGLTGLVDCLIPRGGAGLIRAVVETSRIPVLETGTGVCHVYVHSAADLATATAIAANAKMSNPAVCNAMETLLVDAAVAGAFLPQVAAVMQGVELRGCERTRQVIDAAPATEEDWAAEYLDLILAIRVVEGLGEAIAHIRRWGTAHSEAIVTEDKAVAERFLREVDSAAVYHNASTRFTDGFEFGFGAEIGISTQKLHARGPMGLAELTSYKYVGRGTGQIR